MLEEDTELQKFFADAVEVARASTELLAAVKLVDSLEDAGCEDADTLRTRFIQGVAARVDVSYTKLRAVARALNLGEDEILVDDAPELAEALVRASVREGRSEILESRLAEDFDWLECDKVELQKLIGKALGRALKAAAIGQELSWGALNLSIETIAPIVFLDPLDRVDWLFTHFDDGVGGCADTDLREMLTERVVGWLLSVSRRSPADSDESRLRRAKELAGQAETWGGWLELDPMEDARATLCQALGEDVDDE